MNIEKVPASDAGCWVDGHWGHYGPERVQELAAALGWTGERIGPDDDVDAYMDATDDAERWMNDNVAADGYVFGWWDGGFYYWSDQEWQDA